MAESEFMMTAEEIRLRNLKRRRILISSIALVVLLIGGFFGARPASNAIKAWQARRHAAKAFDYIENGNWLEARKEATAAYQLRPIEPQAVRAVARFLSRIRQPEALEFWQQLEKIAPLTREDRQDEAAIAIKAGETPRAEGAVKALVGSKDVGPADWLLAAQLSIQEGAADDAMSALTKIFSDPRATEQQQLQAAMMELSFASGSDPSDERMTDAWSRIEKIARGKTGVALDALVLLSQRELSSPISTSQRLNNLTAEDIARRLETHPLARAPQKLLALDVRAKAVGANIAELLADGIAQLKNGDANELLALATWLNNKNEFQKMLESIPLEKALTSRELLLQYLDALGGLGRWTEIKQLLESERYPLDPVVQRMYLARCNAQLGEKTAAENNWQRALEAAGGDVGKLISLGEYAEKNGVIDVARSAFDAAVTEAPKLRVAQQGRLRIAQYSGDTKKIHAVLADILTLWPNDAAIQNDEAYTRLLLMQQSRLNGYSLSENGRKSEGELDQVVQLAANLLARNPRSMPHRTLLALAYLKENRGADALAVYDKINITRGALTPSALAVHAAVLATNGKADDAKKEAQQIRDDQLLPEERQLIADLR